MIRRDNLGWAAFLVLLIAVCVSAAWDTRPMVEMRRNVAAALGPDYYSTAPKLQGRRMTRLEAGSRSWLRDDPEPYTLVEPLAGSGPDAFVDSRPMPVLPGVMSDNYTDYGPAGSVTPFHHTSHIKVWVGEGAAKPMLKQKRVRTTKWVRGRHGRKVKVSKYHNVNVRVMAVEVEPLHAATRYR